MVFFMNLLKKVQESESTKHLWRDKHNSEEWRNANKLNALLFGIPLNNKPKCSCLEDLFFMLKSKNINIKYKEKMEQVFKIKKGKVINSFAFGFHLTEQSNDEQIKEALKLQPNLIVHFESYPKDWRVVVGLDEPIESLSLKELKMLAPDFGGKSKKEFIAHLSAK